MKAQFMLKYGGQPALWPVMVGLSDNIDIFSVPVKNAVGTNSINNAITLLRFNNDQIVFDELRRNFIDGVGSGNKYYPGIFSDKWIGYTQTRGFLLFNVQDKSFADQIPLQSGDEYFTKVVSFDAEKQQFLFQLRDDRYLESKRFLRLFQFDLQGNYQQISDFETGPHGDVGYSEPWAIQNKTVFIYDDDSIKITAYDSNFKQVAHPFCDLFNSLKEFRSLDQLTIHPTLPIAILVEIEREERSGYKVYLANWENPDPDRRFIELLDQEISVFSGLDIQHLSVSDFQFSPDGDWLVFRDESEVQRGVTNPIFIAMPVNGKREMPIGKPQMLGKVMRENAYPTSTAWIKEPLSFVVSDGLVLYKWELNNLPREFKD